jgi:hypothetical protein
MVEAIGLLLGLVGVVFAFEKPRKWIVGLFHKPVAVDHTFKASTQFHAHNNGKELGTIGTNQTERTHVFEWWIVNRSSEPIQIERGMLLKGAASGDRDLVVTPSSFTTDLSILPKHKVQLLQVELTAGEVDHYRHWVREATAFGVKAVDGSEYLVPVEQLEEFRKALTLLAKEYGLADDVPLGKTVAIVIKRERATPKSEA